MTSNTPNSSPSTSNPTPLQQPKHPGERSRSQGTGGTQPHHQHATASSRALLLLTRYPSLINSVSGAFSGIVVSVSMSPFDVIKTRLTVQRAHADMDPRFKQFHGFFRSVHTMVKNEGFLSLYKGLGTTLFGYVPNWAIYFATYEYWKQKCSRYIEQRQLLHISSSLLAGTMTSILMSPIWVVKTRLQTQLGTHGYPSAWSAVRSIVSEEGVRGLFRGLSPSLLGLSHVAIQFTLYEQFKYFLVGVRKRKQLHSQQVHKQLPPASPSPALPPASPLSPPSPASPASPAPQQPASRMSLMDILLASSASKLIASVAAYPHEVLRNRLQDHGHMMRTYQEAISNGAEHLKHVQIAKYAPYKGLFHAIRTIRKEEGWLGFYHGMGTNLLRVVPAAMLTLLSFEISKQFLTEQIERRKQ